MLETSQTKRHPWAIVAMSLAIVCVGGLMIQQSFAQDIAMESERTEIRIPAGTVFEIMGVTNDPAAAWSWVLTEDRVFIEAGRKRVFRVRLPKPGKYTLDAGIANGSTVTAHSRMTINVQPIQDWKEPDAASGAGASDSTIVRAMPEITNGSIVLRPGYTVLLLKPGTENGNIDLDTDITTDVSRDGEPANDVENDDTFFRTDGSPLYMWFPGTFSKRSMRLRQGTHTRDIVIYGNSRAIEQHEILVEEEAHGVMHFHVQFRGNDRPPGSLLYHWTFGDGQESFIESPSHVYKKARSYNLAVEILSLETAKTITTLEKTVTAPYIPLKTQNASSQGQPAVGSGGDDEADPEKGKSKTDRGSLVKTVFIGGGVLVLTIGIGFGLMFLIGLFRKSGGLQKKLEQMEGSLMKNGKDAKSIIDVPAAPMEIKRKTEFIPPMETKKEGKPESPKAAPEAPAPLWLKKGLDASKTAPQKTADARSNGNVPETPMKTNPEIVAMKNMPSPSAPPPIPKKPESSATLPPVPSPPKKESSAPAPPSPPKLQPESAPSPIPTLVQKPASSHTPSVASTQRTDVSPVTQTKNPPESPTQKISDAPVKIATQNATPAAQSATPKPAFPSAPAPLKNVPKPAPKDAISTSAETPKNAFVAETMETKDEPVAFIRAESLEDAASKGQGGTGKEEV